MLEQQPPKLDVEVLQREIDARIHFFDLPPEGFDPTTADPQVLDYFGIPRRPDPREHPLLTDFWDEVYAPPLTYAPQRATIPASQLRIGYRQFRLYQRLQRSARARARVPREGSLNWSGAYITPRDGRQITQVHGRWTVPAVAAPDGEPPEAEYQSSTWIGLDGQRRYLESTLPQIGTNQSVNPAAGKPYWAWFQWWVRDDASSFVPVELPLAVAPGHRMRASMRVVTETEVHFTMVNRTTGWIIWFTMQAPIDADSKVQIGVSGATAEWITERPSDIVSGEPYNLPNYGTVPFTSCFAMAAELPPGGVPGPAVEQTLIGGRRVSMYRRLGDPSRSEAISKPQRLGEDRLDTVFVV